MKKVFSLLFVFLPLVSCQKENATPAPEADVAFVSIRNFETKSQIGTDAVLTWSENDRIAVFGDSGYTSSEFTYRSGAGYTTAAFGGHKPAGENFVVCHPSDSKCDGITFRGILDTKVSHKMPSQILGSLPMWGKTDDLSKVTLTGVCGILRLNMKGSCKLSAITLNADRPVSGEFLCSLEDDLFAMIGGAKIIHMETNGVEIVPSEATSFYFVLPPGEYESMKVNLTDIEGEVSYLTLEDAFVIEPGVFTSVLLDL